MISEQDKQAILNGTYGVSRNDLKCKFIGNAVNTDDYTHTFIYLNKEGLIYTLMKLNDNFKSYDKMDSDFDVVGLWEDKPEPFDLKRALAGEPVLIRDGSKGYVFANLNDIAFKENMSCSDYLPLRGVIVYENNGKKLSSETWTLNGRASSNGEEDYYDIIGMWKEPEPVPNTVTLTLPCPLKEPQADMWFIGSKGNVAKSTYIEGRPDHTFWQESFNAGFYFGSEADAQEWLNALRNNRR